MGELILTSIVRRVFAVWLPWKKRGSKRGIEEGFPWSCGCGAFSGRVVIKAGVGIHSFEDHNFMF